jgi:fructokinase
MRLGIDLGGTKTEIIALDATGAERFRHRIPSPQGDYSATLRTLTGLVREAEGRIGETCHVGIGIPGTVSATSGLIKNANSTWLIGKPLAQDLRTALGRDVRLANDANCFALSEASDGAGAGLDVVFGVILGTGVGGGVVVHGKVLDGAHGIAGEWGHNPLPGMGAQEFAEIDACYCGQRGCIESFCSGPGLAADFFRHGGFTWTAEKIAASDDAKAIEAVTRFTHRLARSLASVMNLLDPDAIVLGGGLSNMQSLYRDLPSLVDKHAFTPEGPPRILRNQHGDSSGVRGAAWLWPP